MGLTNESREPGGVRVGSGMPISAVVSAGNLDTHYYRLGHGLPVVVLDIRAVVAARRIPGDLLELSRSCRVIVPDLHRVVAVEPPIGPVATSFATWLGGFVEGLGLDSVRFLVSWLLEEQLLGLLPRLSGRVDRVAIIGGAVAEPPATKCTGVSSVVIWRAGTGRPWPEIHEFLLAKDGSTPIPTAG